MPAEKQTSAETFPAIKTAEDTDTRLQVLDIIPGTSVDGPGLRTSIYFAGCKHRCAGCHNPQSWDFNAGRSMTVKEIAEIVDHNGFNVTFSGGDPLYQLTALSVLAKEIRSLGYTIWCYTGFRYEEICHLKGMETLLQHIEVLVDGPFEESRKDLALLFRGSSNQRLIKPAESSPGSIELWTPDF